jgi:hypothetical protein
MSTFYLQIVDADGRVVQLPAGGSLERDFIQLCTDAILASGAAQIEAACTAALRQALDTAIEECVTAISAHGIGFFKSAPTVQEAIRQGLRATLNREMFVRVVVTQTAAQTLGSTNAAELIREGIRQAMQTLKDRSREAV